MSRHTDPGQLAPWLGVALLTTQGHEDPRELGGWTWDIGIAGPPVHVSTGPAPPDSDRRDGRMRWNGLARHLSTSRLPEAPGTGKRLEELERGNRK